MFPAPALLWHKSKRAREERRNGSILSFSDFTVCVVAPCHRPTQTATDPPKLPPPNPNFHHSTQATTAHPNHHRPTQTAPVRRKRRGAVCGCWHRRRFFLGLALFFPRFLFLLTSTTLGDYWYPPPKSKKLSVPRGALAFLASTPVFFVCRARSRNAPVTRCDLPSREVLASENYTHFLLRERRESRVAHRGL